MDEVTERAVAAVALAVGRAVADELDGDVKVERRAAVAMRTRLGELVWARATASRPRPESLEVADEASVIALCAVASARARGAVAGGLDVAGDVNRAARAAAVRAWKRALAVTVSVMARDPVAGRTKTERVTLEGPFELVECTTAPVVPPNGDDRCHLLRADEDDNGEEVAR